MKKLNVFNLILLLSVSFTSSSQSNGVAIYNKKSNLTLSVNLNKTVNSKTIAEQIERNTYQLKFNDSLASYKQTMKFSKTGLSEFSQVFSGYKGPYFFDFKKRSIFRKKGKYLIEKKYDSLKWKLKKESIVINNLTCYKATTVIEEEGRTGIIFKDVVAWYAPQISVNAGPDGFGGLPGLIVQLEFKNIITTLKNIKFLEKTIKISPPKYEKLMLEHDFKNYTKDLINNRKKYYGN